MTGTVVGQTELDDTSPLGIRGCLPALVSEMPHLGSLLGASTAQAFPGFRPVALLIRACGDSTAPNYPDGSMTTPGHDLWWAAGQQGAPA